MKKCTIIMLKHAAQKYCTFQEAFAAEEDFLLKEGVVVQWLDYLAVTQETGVRFPATAEKCHLMWRCPSGQGIN